VGNIFVYQIPESSLMNLHRWMLGLNLTPVLWVNIGAMLVALVTAFLLVWQNSIKEAFSSAARISFSASSPQAVVAGEVAKPL
jgi:hypothetical protein